jgi:hypothetical protein
MMATVLAGVRARAPPAWSVVIAVRAVIDPPRAP